MKVKDVIKKLQECDSEAEVITCSSSFELHGADVSVTMIHQYDTGNKTERTFFDAFDHEYYEKEVYSITGGTEKVVYIA